MESAQEKAKEITTVIVGLALSKGGLFLLGFFCFFVLATGKP